MGAATGGGGVKIKALAVVVLGVLLSTTAACDPQREPGLITVPSENPTVNAATAEARASLPVFWSAYDAAASKYGFILKVRMPTRGGGWEHLWMNVTGRQGDQVTGTLSNTPLEVPGVALGSSVTVKAEQITDWGYAKDGMLFGNFTTRALLPMQPPEIQAETRKLLSPSPLERPAQ
jgi:uncharacterized protein YegJ (DUF2314 family)